MTEKSMTRRDLAEAVYQKAGLSRSESTAFVDLVLMEIASALEKGETIKLSSVGSFIVRKKGRRTGRNLKAGAEVISAPRGVMVFEPSAILKPRTELSGGTDTADQEPLESETQVAALIETIAGALKATASELAAINDRIERIVSMQSGWSDASVAGGSLGSAK